MENKIIANLLNEMDLFFKGKSQYNSEVFSLFVEDFLCDNYDAMYSENPEVTELLNEDIPEICAIMEPGLDDTEFKEKLKVQYEAAKNLYQMMHA